MGQPLIDHSCCLGKKIKNQGLSGDQCVVVTDWISETQTERRRLEAEIHALGTSANPPLTREQITELITELGNITSVLRQAEPDAKAKLYRQLDLRLDYDPETQTVSARIDLGTTVGG